MYFIPLLLPRAYYIFGVGGLLLVLSLLSNFFCSSQPLTHFHSSIQNVNIIDFDFPEVLEVIWKKKFDCEVTTRQRVDLALMASELPFSVSLEDLTQLKGQ